jgi:hypothetical protein
VALANATNNTMVMGLADRPGADMTARLLLALTALYVERPTHTDEEQQQYAELALRLIDKVDAATRATVAGILRGHAAAPAQVRERLAQAPSTPAGAPDRALPQGMGPHARPDPAPAEPAAIIARARSPHAADADVSDRPAGSAAPAPAELGEAFFAANAAERRELLSRIAAGRESRDGAQADGPHGQAIPADLDNPERRHSGLDAAAMDGRIGEFIREFERLLSIPRSLCERIVNDRSGEPMVIAAKAANLPIAVLQRILLLVNPAVSHSVQRVYDLTDLFHDIDRGAAVELLSLWRARAAPDTAAQPEPSEKKSQRDMPGLRSRFGALAERIRGQDTQRKGVSARPDPGNAARRDLRSR